MDLMKTSKYKKPALHALHCQYKLSSDLCGVDKQIRAQLKQEYEFLDLSDVKEAELKGLQCALFDQRTEVSTISINGYTEPSTEEGPCAVEMSQCVPAETGGEVGVRPPAYGPPPYAAPPPWAPPPNVYVSQVTANVNVHPYMGQYCPQPQQYPNGPRPPRRDRRPKRPASPPPQAPPPHSYYVPYPGYYGAGGAAGAPLYQLPMYQPVMYPPPYYHPYCGEYVEEEEEVPEGEFYPPYYPGAHDHHGPEYYVPHAAPHPLPPLPRPPTTHHFNVHAKNFVLPNHVQSQIQNQPPAQLQNQMQMHTPPQPHIHSQTHIQTQTNKPQISNEKPPVELKITPTASASASVDTLPMKELKIATKSQTSPKNPSTSDDTANPTVSNQSKPSPVTSEKSSPPPIKVETKPAWTPTENKTPDVSANTVIQPVKTFTTTPPAAVSSPTVTTAKIAQPVAKISKGPTAPFSGNSANKPSIKPATTHIGVSVQPPATTPKPPFSNRQRKDAPPRSPPQEPAAAAASTPAPAPAPAPSAPKPPFTGGRRSTSSPVLPAPWEFPPPPCPRNRPSAPRPTSPALPPAAPGKSWASLFQKPPAPVPISAPAPASPGPAPRPVAKVPPYDASPVVPAEPPPTQYAVKAPPAPETKETTPVPAPQPSPFADDPNSYRMGEFLSKYQLDNRAVSLLPRGLTNRSNYCYVNAILQALIACPPLYNMLKALPYQTRRGKSSTPVIDAMVELCYEFTVVGGRSGRGAASLPVVTGAALDGAAGLRVLRALTFPGAAEGRQEDAEEFLGCLLNGLNDEMLELMKLVEPEESKESQQNGVVQELLPEDDDDDDEWKVMGPRNKGAIERRWAAGRTPLSDIFRGRTRCRLHRAQAHDVTDAVQPFFTLQLDIERANNVKDALELLAGKDTLEGVTDAWQQLSLEQLPVVLLLHLKCFQLDSEGHTAKIVKNIDFPIDLKIDPKIMSSKAKYTTKQRMYKLFAVVYHEGVEAVKGHYLTDTYHGQAGWIRYDDSTVTLVNDGQVLKPKPPRMPYILMYRRQDTLPIPHRPVPKTD